MTLPKQTLPIIFERALSDWRSTVHSEVRKLDRINGQIQWTPEAVRACDAAHDFMLEYVVAALKELDLTHSDGFYWDALTNQFHALAEQLTPSN